MRISQILTLLLTVLCFGLAAHPTWAAPDDAEEAEEPSIEQQFEEARKLFADEEYQAALPLFRQVLERTGSPNARLYLARCLKQLGQIAEAYEEMAETVRDATEKAKTEDKYAPTRNVAAVHLATLEPLVGKLVVALSESASGATVTMDGEALEPDRIGAQITLKAGTVTIAASAPGKLPWEQDVEIPGGGTKTVTVSLKSATTSPPPPTDGDTTGGGVRIAGYVVAGVGVAGIVVMAVTGAMAQGKVDTLEEECGGVRCADLSYAEVVDDARTLQTVANVSLVVGIAGIVAGTAMIVFGGPTETHAAWLDVSPGGGVLRYRGRF